MGNHSFFGHINRKAPRKKTKSGHQAARQRLCLLHSAKQKRAGLDASTHNKENPMQKTDVTELRKHLKKAPNEPGIIDWVYGVYVSPENEAVCETILSYDTMEDEDRFRYAGILNKAIPANVGAALIPIGVAQNNELADCANNGGADDIPEVLSELRDRLMEEYVHTDPYYAVAMRILYDVPARSSDGAYLEDGNALYSAIVFAVCPAKLSTPALGLENGQVENLTRRWTVGAPAFGFLLSLIHI